MMAKMVALIPAYNPPRKLIRLVQELLQRGVFRVVVVNDGSEESFRPIFDQLRGIAKVDYLEHPDNLGKGAALKTGLKYIYEKYPQSLGVVTADADGQHSASDIVKIAKVLIKNPSSLVLGCRQISRDIPWRSWFGNTLTQTIFFWLTNKRISDTQSGLRGLPMRFISRWQKLPGRGYEYEMNLLLAAAQANVNIIEEPIRTIYLAGNISSHFHPLLDSMRIYFVLLRYVLSSLLAAVIDIFFFSLIFLWLGNVTISMLISRYVIGALVNFTVNHTLVFHSRVPARLTLVRYYILATIAGLVASVGVIQLMSSLGWPVLASKIVVEVVLFPLVFIVQKRWVFAHRYTKSPS